MRYRLTINPTTTTCTALLSKLIRILVSLMVLMFTHAIFIDVSIIVRFSMIFQCVCCTFGMLNCLSWVSLGISTWILLVYGSRVDGNDTNDLFGTLFFVAMHTHCIILLGILYILISLYNVRFIDVIWIVSFQFGHDFGFCVNQSIRLPEIGRKHSTRR